MAVLNKPQFADSPQTTGVRGDRERPIVDGQTADYMTGERGDMKVVAMKTRGVSQPEDRHRERPAAKPFLMEHDLLTVRNDDSVPWKFEWDRRQWVLKPGQVTYIPFPAVVNKLGDPRSVEGTRIRYYSADSQTRGIIPSRYETLCSLFAAYGIRGENVDALVDFAPKVTVTTMQGQPVTFPCQNPNMLPFPTPQDPEPGREGNDSKRMIDAMADRNADLEQEVASLRALVEERLGGNAQPYDDEATAGTLGGGALPDTGPATGF